MCKYVPNYSIYFTFEYFNTNSLNTQKVIKKVNPQGRIQIAPNELVWVKWIENFLKNQIFYQKNKNFRQKSNFSSKIKIFVKNQIFYQNK